MKIGPIACLAFGALCFALVRPQSKTTTIVFGGNFQGFLSPCGCTQPMAGGIKRAATLIRQIESGGNGYYLVGGGLVSGTSRQDELKAEALAEYCRSLSASALAYTAKEARLGPGEALEMDQLSGGLLVNSSIIPPPELNIAKVKAAGPFLFAAVSLHSGDIASRINAQALSVDATVDEIVQSATREKLVVVVTIDGGEADATELANKHPQLGLIEYQSDGDPPAQPLVVNKATLVTAGAKGKTVVQMSFDGLQFSQYSVTHLDPQFNDDPAVARIYARYLARVGQENLLDALPRSATKRYAGSSTCNSCHGEAFRVWKASGHSHAYGTLLGQSHGRDPDCAGCHVVGLESQYGFRSLKSTPQLANVGCESCHGPARQHAINPRHFPLPKVGEQPCLTCHTSENSPGFDFKVFWPRIRHR